MLLFILLLSSLDEITTISSLEDNLKIYKVPESITEITANFEGSTNTLQQIDFLGKKVKKLSPHIFMNCYLLNSINLENCAKLKMIPEHAFCNCSSLKSIKLPTNTRTIARCAFFNCTSLMKIIFPQDSQLEYIMNDCFSYTSIVSFTIPFKVKSIAERSFRWCTKLRTFQIDDNKYFSFENSCLILKQISTILTHAHADPNPIVTIPENVCGIYGYAFAGSNTEGFVFYNTAIQFYRQCFIDMPKIQHADLSGANSFLIGSNIFENCTELITCILPKTQTYMSAGIFLNCYKLENVTLGRICTSIGADMFTNCTRLKYVTCTRMIWKQIQENYNWTTMVPTIYPDILVRIIDITNYKCIAPFHCIRDEDYLLKNHKKIA